MANPTVGFGPPDIVTVGADAIGLVVPFDGVDPDARMVNRLDTA